MLIRHDALTDAITTLFVHGGASDQDARQVAHHLVEANLRGHHSHGVGMVPAYTHNLRNGHLQPTAHARVVRDDGAILVLDGQHGFGQVVGPQAIAAGIRRAQESGACILGLKDAHHLGRIGAYGEQVAAAGLVSMHYVNVVGHEPQVAPWQGAARRLGTNPFCCAIPVADGPPLVLDMATSAIAAGKVRVAANRDVPVPDNCLLDADGNPTNDPHTFGKGGALTHFGMHKGYGLAIVCELLGGTLIGQWSAAATERRPGTIVNHMLAIIIDPARTGGSEDFPAAASTLLDYLRDTPSTRDGDKVLIPGEPERMSTQAQTADGIDVDEVTWQGIERSAELLGLSPQALNKQAGVSGRA